MQDNIDRIFKYKLLTSWQLGDIHKNVGIKALPNCIFTHRLELRIYNVYFYSNDIYIHLWKKNVAQGNDTHNALPFKLHDGQVTWSW
jgi:hypothetical protein